MELEPFTNLPDPGRRQLDELISGRTPARAAGLKTIGEVSERVGDLI